MTGWQPGRVDPSRPHFELVHSFYKETAALLGLKSDRTCLVLEYVDCPSGADPRVRADVEASITARLRDCGGTADDPMARLQAACAGPANLYARVHWCLVDPALPPLD